MGRKTPKRTQGKRAPKPSSTAELTRSLEAYTRLVELCHAAVISAGPDGRIRSWNPAAQTLFGYTPAEAAGRDIRTLVPEASRERFLSAVHEHVRRVKQGPFHRTLTVSALRKDGREVPVEVSLAAGGPPDDRILTAVVRDISEHLAVVEKLNDALQRLRFHIERMPLAYIVWDTDFRVVEWNPSAEAIFGYTRDEALGRHAYELIVPKDATHAVDQVWSDLLRGDTSSHSVNPNVRKGGLRMTCEWFNTPLRDSAGRIHGVASMVRDVTEREAMEARIRDAQKLESLGVLAGGIAHDFNNSLMVILGNAALLRSFKGLPARAMEHIELIEEAGSRSNQLIKHLLAYARTGRHNPQPTDLNALIRDSYTFVHSSIGKAHELILSLGRDLPLIRADRSQVEQIILNLCLNAKQAMPSGGDITLTTGLRTLSGGEAGRCMPYDIKPGDYLEMTVSDTGVGMDDATRARVFDPFFTTKPEGHGLGLAAVLGILRQHQGAVCIDSQPGRGTKMHVFLPVQRRSS